MRKLINWVKITFTGNKLAQYATWATMVTTALLSAAESDDAARITSMLGVVEERKKVVDILNRLLPDFRSATTHEGRMAIAQRIGSEIIYALSDGKIGISRCIEIFELFLKKS